MQPGGPPTLFSFAAPLRSRTPSTTKFRTVVQAVLAELDQHVGERWSVGQLQKRHQIKHRRLYDVVNVFTALGCASRVNGDEILWHGRDQIITKLLQEKEAMNIGRYDVPLATLFPPETSVGLSSLTVSFLMLFPALATREIDLREASAFFARQTQKYKTVLCKLYQIATILGSLGLTNRTENVCQIRLLLPVMRLLDDQQNPMAIDNLLNRPIIGANGIDARREEYKRFSLTAVGKASGPPPEEE
jgi:hypothetical protein